MIFYFTSIILINLFIFHKNMLFLFLLFISLYLLGKKIDIKLYIISCISIGLFFSLNCNYYKNHINEFNINEILTVTETHENYSIVKNDKGYYLIYNNENTFKEGNKILFDGKLISIENSYNSFYNYLNKKNIYYQLDYTKCQIVNNTVKSNILIIDKLLNKKSERSKSYLKLILFNVKEETNIDFYNNFSLYSLTYLIAVSGFHINLLLSFFRKVFRNNIVGICIITFYLYLLNFSISSYRAFLCYIFKYINKKFSFNISNLGIISLIGSCFIICNPNIMFSFSYIYSFLITIALEILKLYKSNKVTTATYIYLINIPILLMHYYKLNLSTLLFGFILNIPVSFLYIFSFIFLFFDKFYLLYDLTIELFFKLFEVLNKINLTLIMGKPSIYFIIIYYLVLLYFFILKERKSRKSFICIPILLSLIIYQYYKPMIVNDEQVYFLNVGQGDCVVFFIPHSKEVVLVDTGGSRYKDIATTKIIPFLESKGINKIKEIILTHDDFDHIGATNSLKEHFNVENIIKQSSIEEIKIGKNTFKNLNINENRDNDGSIVLYGKYGGYNILLMGDASIEVEKNIVKYINSVDIIKIGHHGSNTSSSYEFLDAINGKIAIISVGSNTYGHPNDEVLKKLITLNYIILRTDENNDIGFGKYIFDLSFVDYFN